MTSDNILDYLDNKDFLVNSTNKYMICGSGIWGTIYKNAVKGLLKDYCKRIYESKSSIQDLLESYNNIFLSTNKKGYKNIASVSLGTGIHSYKHNEIAKVVISKLNEFVNKYGIDIA